MPNRYFNTRHRTKRRTFLPFSIVAGLGLLFFIAMFFSYNVYLKLFNANVVLPDPAQKYYLYIPTGSDFKTVVYLLDDNRLLKDTRSFIWVSRRMHFNEKVHPGRFLIKNNMTNYDLVSVLRSNSNVPVLLVLNRLHSPEELAGFAGRYLELDSFELIKMIRSNEFKNKWHVTDDEILTCFIPNTYEFYWNTDADAFLDRMKKEYDKFWNESRKAKAGQLGLTPVQVSILASIIQEESSKIDELPRIAGVYLNRLRKGMLLQADPTLKFAINDRTIKRVLNEHKKVDSPYNTYKYPGLPPGPITMPDIISIDAVLNAESHNYFYFCAKADLSGYHNFSTSYKQHLLYARQYQHALNKLNIR